MKKSRSFKEYKKEKNFFVSVFLGSILAMILGLVLLLLSAFPALLLEDPMRYAPVFAIASLFIATTVGGYLAGRTHRKSGLACGALSAIFTVAILIIFAFAFGLKIRTELFIICVPALIILSAIAGICGSSTERTPKPKHKIKF